VEIALDGPRPHFAAESTDVNPKLRARIVSRPTPICACGAKSTTARKNAAARVREIHADFEAAYILAPFAAGVATVCPPIPLPIPKRTNAFPCRNGRVDQIGPR
jgi:hypothetical protein